MIPGRGGGYNAAELETGASAALSFGDPVVVQQDGYIYIWVSNASENTKVWFDDLKITQSSAVFVTQATDYGVWGEVLREQKADESIYRYGYQGQFSERDLETGWTHFEVREYDPVAGRWLIPDPARQYWSPYIAMGNDPVLSVDPNGEYAGTIIGGLIGAGIAAWRGENVWKGALTGAVAGAVFDAVYTGGSSLAVVALAGAASGAAGNIVDQTWDILAGDQQSFSIGEFAVSTGVGGLGGVAGAALGKFLTGPITKALGWVKGYGTSNGYAKVAEKATQEEIIAAGNSVDDAAQAIPRFWNKTTTFRNTKVYQRDDLIDPNIVDALGRTNLQRMRKGLAPLGPDGNPLNVHHMLQTNSGPVAEMSQTFHQTNYSTIHINPNTIPSGINRSVFNAWRRSYWKNRARDF